MKKIRRLFLSISLLFLLTSCVEYDPKDETIITDPTVEPTLPTVDPTIVPSDPTEIIPTIYTFTLNPGSDTVELNTAWIDRGAYLNVETGNVEVMGTHQVDTTTLGTYLVNYDIVYEEITYHLTRIVIVVDQTPPRLTLNPGIDSIKVGETWVDGYVTVTDNSLQEVDIQIIGTVNTNQVGQYQIIYTATDSSGNTSQITRIVTVYQ
jgi:hypothetical protein